MSIITSCCPARSASRSCGRPAPSSCARHRPNQEQAQGNRVFNKFDTGSWIVFWWTMTRRHLRAWKSRKPSCHSKTPASKYPVHPVYPGKIHRALPAISTPAPSLIKTRLPWEQALVSRVNQICRILLPHRRMLPKSQTSITNAAALFPAALAFDLVGGRAVLGHAPGHAHPPALSRSGTAAAHGCPVGGRHGLVSKSRAQARGQQRGGSTHQQVPAVQSGRLGTGASGRGCSQTCGRQEHRSEGRRQHGIGSGDAHTYPTGPVEGDPAGPAERAVPESHCAGARDRTKHRAQVRLR